MSKSLQRKKSQAIRRVKKAGTWDRGYLCHVYWCGTRKLGVVRTGERGQWDGAYRWECPESNVRGTSMTLSRAKIEIESVVHSGVYQLDLFEEQTDAGQTQGQVT